MEWWHWAVLCPVFIWALICFVIVVYFWAVTGLMREEFFVSFGLFAMLFLLPLWWPLKRIKEYFESRAIRKYMAEIREKK